MRRRHSPADRRLRRARKTAAPTATRRSLLAAAAGAGLASGLSGTAHAADPPTGEFAGQSAFVTGGARGIGYACAVALAQRGANIVLYDIAEQITAVPYPLASAADLAAAKAGIEKLGVGCIAVQGDVRDLNAQQAAMNHAVEQFGSVNFVVGNAGILQVGALEQFSESELSLVIDINLKGVIKTVQAATRFLRRQNSGRIILISSLTGRTGSARFPVYAATKWGVIGLAKSTAIALGPHNVTCNAICPTLVRTKLIDNDYMLAQIAPGQQLTFAQLAQAARARHTLPVGFLEPQDIGDCVHFLCSDAAKLISGDVFDVGAGINSSFPA